MKVAILEYICGSGILRVQQSSAQAHPWSALLSEGHAMLSALARDMLDAGIDVACPLESSIAAWGQWASWTDTNWSWSPVSFDPQRSIDDVATLWSASVRDCDAAIVIAPELDGALSQIIARLRDAGLEILAGDKAFLAATCDQWNTCQAWQARNVRHPRTRLLEEFLHNDLDPGPSHLWVVKRRDSAGCVGQRRMADTRSVAREALRCSQSNSADRWVVQPWISGQAASLAALVGQEIRVVGAFRQRFETIVEDGETGWGYSGGVGPIPGITQPALQRFASEVLHAIPGKPRGWIGIDFVIEPDGQWSAIEVNPRLTTSYLGYRQWYGHQLAGSWARGNPPPREPQDFSQVCFSLENFEG
ncbi:MAG: ATP-grasp domain-containing protein [Planctomycetota bacterium]